MVCLLCGLILTTMNDDELATTKLWMIPYGIPELYCLTSLILFFTCFREEPLDFLLKKGENCKAEAIRVINKIYIIEGPEDSLHIYHLLS